VIVYSCNMGGGEGRDFRLLEPLKQARKGNSFVLFTDRKDLRRSEGSEWEIRALPSDLSGRLAARWAKTHPHVLFPGKATLWIDANMRMVRSAEDLNNLASGLDAIALIHPRNGSLQAEADQIHEKLQLGRSLLDIQLSAYAQDSFNISCGPVTSTGFLFRKANDITWMFNEFWWKQLQTWGHLRDQMSFDFCAWKCNMRVGHLDGHFLHNDFFDYFTHAGKPAKKAYRYLGVLAAWKKGGLLK